MEYDDMLKSIGTFGKYQKKVVCLLCLVGFPASFQNLGYIFWAVQPDFICDIPKPEYLQNISHELWTELTFRKSDDDTWSLSSQCSKYTLNYSAFSTQDDVVLYMNNRGNSDEYHVVEECNQWQYDESQFKSSIVTQFDLVCGRGWLRSLSQSVYMGGKMIGTVLFGLLADRFGRRIVLLSTMWAQAIAGCVIAFSPNVYFFLVLRFLIALAITGTYEIAYVLAMEFVGPSARDFAGNMFMVTWAIGYMSLACIAYYIRDHFIFQIVTMLPLLFLAALYWFVPESPRWLFLKGKEEAAIKIISNIARDNNRNVPLSLEIKNIKPEKNQNEMPRRRVLGKPFLWLMTFTLWLIWLSNSVVYFGLSYNSSNIVGNFFFNNFISGAVEIPAYVFTFFVYKRFGRQKPLLLLMILAGASLIISTYIPREFHAVVVTLAMIGKFAITCTFSMSYIYTSELYPTSVRSLGIGVCNGMARLGGTIAPFASEIDNVYPDLSCILFGALAMLAGLSAVLLPETKGKKMPQVLAEGEELAKSASVYCCMNSQVEEERSGEEQEKEEESLMHGNIQHL